MTVLHTEVLDGSTADLLSRISEDKVFRDFYLAGGTGLALQLGHRMSLDLGLFSEGPWSPVFLLNAVRALRPTVIDLESEGTLVGSVGGVRVSFSYYPYPLLEPLRLGFDKADGVLALVVAVAIASTAFTILRGVGHTLGDAARLPEAEIATAAASVDGVMDCHSVRTRGSESRVFVDMHIEVARDTTLERSHEIAHAVEAELRARYSEIVDVVAHVEPALPSPARDGKEEV